MLLHFAFLAACSPCAHNGEHCDPRGLCPWSQGHQPCLPGSAVLPLCLCQQEACLFLELLHGTTSPNYDTSWLYSQTIKVMLTRAGLLPCFGGYCSKGSASALGSSQHSMAQCREVAAAPLPLPASKAAVGAVTLGMRGEGLKLAAAVLSTRFCTNSWLLGAHGDGYGDCFPQSSPLVLSLPP